MDFIVFAKRLLTFFIAIMFVGIIVPDIEFNGLVPAFIVTLLLALINTFVKPVLKFLALPLTMATMGFFPLLLNLVIVYLLADFVPGFSVGGILWVFLFSSLLSVVLWFVDRLVRAV
ncbi:phage holin family protein [Eisenibacter elegans]|jgi:putative membrane protein|uniref:phage holin family protein n=1 Tax=Eisenibacter elegans TaxID=997 RepID=UPI0003FD8EFF|nr:phage holin family protein [Eisenibacter elegans]